MEETQKELTPADYQMYREEGPRTGGRRDSMGNRRTAQQRKQYTVADNPWKREFMKEPILSSPETETLFLQNRLGVWNILSPKRGKNNH